MSIKHPPWKYPTIFLRMKLSIYLVIYVIVEKTKLKAHSYGLYLVRKYLYIKSFWIKPTGTIILYKILTVTCYLFPSETHMVIPKWNTNAQMLQAKMLPSNFDTVVPNWDWHDCSQIKKAQLFPSNWLIKN